MAQSLSKLYVHIIFHVKSTFKQNDSIPIVINGVGDHVHILCIMSKNIALAKLVEEIKKNSSRWIKTKNRYYQNFGWQGGYTGFSVSQSVHDYTKKVYRKSRKTSPNKNLQRRGEVVFR